MKQNKEFKLYLILVMQENLFLKNISLFLFYSYVDGRKDITFNINFLKLNINQDFDEIYHSFEIIGYIIDDTEIAFWKMIYIIHHLQKNSPDIMIRI